MVVITEDETILLRVQSYKTTQYETRRRAFTISTHLSRKNFPIPIRRTSLFQILGVFGGIFHLYSILDRFFVSSLKTMPAYHLSHFPIANANSKYSDEPVLKRSQRLFCYNLQSMEVHVDQGSSQTLHF